MLSIKAALSAICGRFGRPEANTADATPAARTSDPVSETEKIQGIENWLRSTFRRLAGQSNHAYLDGIDINYEKGEDGRGEITARFNFGDQKVVHVKINSEETLWSFNDGPFFTVSEWKEKFKTLSIDISERLIEITDVTIRQSFNWQRLLGRPPIPARRAAATSAVGLS